MPPTQQSSTDYTRKLKHSSGLAIEVGFYVNYKLKTVTREFKVINERMAVLKLKINNTAIKLVQCYALTAVASQEEKTSFITCNKK